MVIALTSILARNEDCPVREIGDGLVIMAPTGDVTHSLEDIGAFIWQQLDGVADLNTILDRLTVEYAVERSVAEEDLRSFVNELLTAEVILQKS